MRSFDLIGLTGGGGGPRLLFPVEQLEDIGELGGKGRKGRH